MKKDLREIIISAVLIVGVLVVALILALANPLLFVGLIGLGIVVYTTLKHGFNLKLTLTIIVVVALVAVWQLKIFENPLILTIIGFAVVISIIVFKSDDPKSILKVLGVIGLGALIIVVIGTLGMNITTIDGTQPVFEKKYVLTMDVQVKNPIGITDECHIENVQTRITEQTLFDQFVLGAGFWGEFLPDKLEVKAIRWRNIKIK